MTGAPQACPHCGLGLKKWLVPEGASWNEEFFFVCFNDNCSYFVEGWDWMLRHYKHKVSYRYMVNPTNGASSSLPVWSNSAMRDMIEEDAPGANE